MNDIEILLSDTIYKTDLGIYEKDNIYSEIQTRHQTDFLHPSRNGSCQKGDALAGVIEYKKGYVGITHFLNNILQHTI